MNNWRDIYNNPLPEYGNKTGVSYLRASQINLEIYCNKRKVIFKQDINKGLGGVIWDCVSIFFL